MCGRGARAGDALVAAMWRSVWVRGEGLMVLVREEEHLMSPVCVQGRLYQTRAGGCLGELVRTEWVRGTSGGAGGAGSAVGGRYLWVRTGSGPEVRVMSRIWAGGGKSKQEHTASLQAHRHSCKKEGVSRQLPSGLSQKGILR